VEKMKTEELVEWLRYGSELSVRDVICKSQLAATIGECDLRAYGAKVKE
jgi:hypothetical protein